MKRREFDLFNQNYGKPSRKPKTTVTGTKPPKIIDLKFWTDPFLASGGFEISPTGTGPIRMQFIMNKDEMQSRSPADEYSLKIKNIDTGEVKYNNIKADNPPYMLYEKFEILTDMIDNNPEDEISIDDVQNSVVNARITIIPINYNGAGPRSVFIIPRKNLILVDTSMLNDYPIRDVLFNNWRFISPDPHDIKVTPRVLYFYMNTPENDIEKDREEHLDKKWRVTTPHNNWEEINFNAFRWLIKDNDVYRKLTKDGWKESDLEEIEFVNGLFQCMRDLYRQGLADRGLDFSEPHMLKFLVPSPVDDRDSIIIYFMKETRWHL